MAFFLCRVHFLSKITCFCFIYVIPAVFMIAVKFIARGPEDWFS